MLKNKIVLISLICILIIGAYYYFSNKELKEISIENILETNTEVEEISNIIIHISGEVHNQRNR